MLDESPISEAAGFALNQRQALCRFLDDDRLPLTNNISERSLRREAVGRKNWIFVGSEDGARANAIFTSLLASCQMNSVEPLSYLRDLLCLLPRWPRARLLELAPAYFQHTAQQSEAQQLLALNPFRQRHPRLWRPHHGFYSLIVLLGRTLFAERIRSSRGGASSQRGSAMLERIDPIGFTRTVQRRCWGDMS